MMLLLLFILVIPMAHSQTPRIEYTLGMSKPSTHLLEVGMSLENLPASDQALDVVLPVWRSGRYVIFDFAGGVQEFTAKNAGGKSLSWKKTDKTTWRVQTDGAPSVRISYKMYANEFHLRTKGLNDEHAFVDPMSTFMYVEKYRSLPLTLTVLPYKNWKVTTGLDEARGVKNKFWAPNYDYFIDCPLEVGTQKEFTFTVDGKLHVIMIYGEGNYDAEVLKTDIGKIVTANKEFWGNLPYERYIFMMHLNPQGGGGTEHINSTIMGVRPFIFRNHETYRSFLGLVSHEFFHTWNVKQLRPAGLSPYNLTGENYSEEFWIAEGTTSYYGSLLLVRIGQISVPRYLETIGSYVQNDRRRPGNTLQSLSEASFDAWIKHWRGNQQSYNSETDYYDKGLHVSLLLDLEIRNRSENKHSLDDVMKAMYQRFPPGGGYTVHDFQTVAEEFTGSSLKVFFEEYVHGTIPLDWEKHLGYAGLTLMESKNDDRAFLGITTSESAGTTRITRVVTGSPAYDAGLDINDELLAFNGWKVNHSNWQSRLNEFKPGEKLKVSLFRAERLREIEITLRSDPTPLYYIAKVETATDLQKRIYESWLKTQWEE
jgi:predicted metalloprotease with PDZ domain